MKPYEQPREQHISTSGVVLAANVPVAVRWAFLLYYKENIAGWFTGRAICRGGDTHFSILSGQILSGADGSVAPLSPRQTPTPSIMA
jgi:hypothetical protein